MDKDFLKRAEAKAAEMRAEFDRARQLPEKAQEPLKRTLEHKPPGPSPMGTEQASPGLVSPYLRGNEERDKEMTQAERMKREFNSAARNPWDRER